MPSDRDIDHARRETIADLTERGTRPAAAAAIARSLAERAERERDGRPVPPSSQIPTHRLRERG